ncbi:MAG: lysophospholipid acyltransferase family protein, partial [candidate division Zixibacteria bacterium]|nr:lysophospholipid acyltransferase family protein [candidate division Zixibacteria bacterium]
TDSVRKSLKWLKAGGVIGVLIDTDSIRVRSIFVPAFGRLALTPVGQTLIGLRAGAAFVPMACLRTAENKYRIVIKPPVETDPNLSSEQAVYDVTCRCTNALEEIIRSAPDQWIWLHNRWRSRPENNS